MAKFSFPSLSWLKKTSVIVPKTEIPDLITSNWEKDGNDILYTLPPSTPDNSYGVYSFPISFWNSLIEDPKPPAADSREFELNMVEALVGWREWRLVNGELKPLFQLGRWVPDIPNEASCNEKHDHKVPAEFCTCGIYAKNTPPEKEVYMNIIVADEQPSTRILGEVYGWGRYVRGEDGWRAQYAYPKSFHIESKDVTPDIMDVLKAYHVPIFVQQPTLIYNPEEDGYANRETDENWSFGASEIADADETTD